MSYTKFLKLSLVTVFLGTSLSTSSWAMESSQEDKDKNSCTVCLAGTQSQVKYSTPSEFAEEPLGEAGNTKVAQPQVMYRTLSEYAEEYRQYLIKLQKIFPFSENLRFNVQAIPDDRFYDSWRAQVEADTKYVQGLKNIFPYSYYLPR